LASRHITNMVRKARTLALECQLVFFLHASNEARKLLEAGKWAIRSQALTSLFEAAHRHIHPNEATVNARRISTLWEGIEKKYKSVVEGEFFQWAFLTVAEMQDDPGPDHEEAMLAAAAIASRLPWFEAKHEMRLHKWSELVYRAVNSVQMDEDAEKANQAREKRRLRNARYVEKQEERTDPAYLSQDRALQEAMEAFNSLHCSHPNRPDGYEACRMLLAKLKQLQVTQKEDPPAENGDGIVFSAASAWQLTPSEEEEDAAARYPPKRRRANKGPDLVGFPTLDTHVPLEAGPSSEPNSSPPVDVKDAVWSGVLLSEPAKIQLATHTGTREAAREAWNLLSNPAQPVTDHKFPLPGLPVIQQLLDSPPAWVGDMGIPSFGEEFSRAELVDIKIAILPAGHMDRTFLSSTTLPSVFKMVHGKRQLWLSWPVSNTANASVLHDRRSVVSLLGCLDELSDLHVTVLECGQSIMLPSLTMHAIISPANSILVGGKAMALLEDYRDRLDMVLANAKTSKHSAQILNLVRTVHDKEHDLLESYLTSKGTLDEESVTSARALESCSSSQMELQGLRDVLEHWTIL